MLHLGNDFIDADEFFDGTVEENNAMLRKTFVKIGNKDMFIHELELDTEYDSMVKVYYTRDSEITLAQIMSNIAKANMTRGYHTFKRALDSLGTIKSATLLRVIPVNSYTVYLEKDKEKK